MTSIANQRARSVADVTKGLILATVDIAVPPERVFDALTKSDEVVKWWGSDELYRTTEWSMDLRAGGKWRAAGKGADGSTFTVGGEVVEVDRPRVLVHTWQPEWDGGHTTTVAYRLEAIDGGTRVTVRHDGFGARAQSCESHASGWERVLGWLVGNFATPDKYFFVRLIPPRATFPFDITPSEREMMMRHAAYWRGMLEEGRAVVFGPVADPKGPWGLGVIKAADEAEVRAVEAKDPPVAEKAGFKYEIFPMMQAVHR
jgi:uncharacterized protein YndB with AHSA1/START domain